MPDQIPIPAPTTPPAATQAPETATSSTSTTTKTATETTEKVNQGAFTNDIHTNISGLVFFAAAVVGEIWPSVKPQISTILIAAGSYIFASSKGKNN
jgi:hypothetical protein